MARVNPNGEQLKTPAQLFLSWSGSKGCFEHYDKESKTNVEVPLPVRFLVLDTLHTLKGFNEEDEVGYYSNEIRDFKTQPFRVKANKNVVYEGLYDSFKDAFKVKGGKYGQSVYVAMRDEKNELFIANIFMGGSALAGGKYKDANKKEIEVGGWMSFAKKNNIFQGAIEVSSITECQKGSNKYKVPNFKAIKVSDETEKQVEELQNQVTTYISAYLSRGLAHEAESVIEKQVEEAMKTNFGGTTEELTSQEKLHLTKPELEENANLPEMGSFPDGEESDLPF